MFLFFLVICEFDDSCVHHHHAISQRHLLAHQDRSHHRCMYVSNHRPIHRLTIPKHNTLSALLVETLINSGLHVHYIHASSHQPNLPDSLPASKLTLHSHPSSTLTSLESLTNLLSSLSPPADLVISAAHGGDVPFQTTVIDASIAAHIHRFMPAEFGHDSRNPHIHTLLPPYVSRAKVLDVVKQRAGDGDIEYIGLATGLSDFGGRLLDGNLGIDLQWESATVFGTGDVVFPISTPAFVAEACAAVISHWDEWKNQYICVSGTVTSFNELVKVLGREMGCLFEVGHLEVKEGRAEARRRIDGGWPDAGMFLLERSVLADEWSFEGFDKNASTREKLGLLELSLKTLVKGAVHDYKHHGKGGCGCT